MFVRYSVTGATDTENGLRIVLDRDCFGPDWCTKTVFGVIAGVYALDIEKVGTGSIGDFGVPFDLAVTGSNAGTLEAIDGEADDVIRILPVPSSAPPAERTFTGAELAPFIGTETLDLLPRFAYVASLDFG